jgi:hypothetical protein
VNGSAPSPNDILAQKRAQGSDAPGLRRPPDSYHVDMLRSESGRADLFRMLRDAGVWCPTPGRKEDRRDWAFARAQAAALLDRLMNEHPLAIGSMWAEWASRWNEERKTQ